MLLHVIIFAIMQTFECPGYDSMWKYLRYFYIMLSVKIKIRKHFSSTIAAQCLSFENKCTLTIGVAWSSDCNFPLIPLKFWLSDNQIYCFHGYQTIDLLFPWTSDNRSIVSMAICTHLFPVLVNVLKRLRAVDSKNTQKALTRPHVLVSHSAEIKFTHQYHELE